MKLQITGLLFFTTAAVLLTACGGNDEPASSPIPYPVPTSTVTAAPAPILATATAPAHIPIPTGALTEGPRPGFWNSQSYLHNVILRVVNVSPDWMAFASLGGWPTAVYPIKESGVLKYFEVAIWEETLSVNLYEFPNDHDSRYGSEGSVTDEPQLVTEKQQIAHREQYLIKKYIDMPAIPQHSDQSRFDKTVERSKFLESTFMDIASYLVDRYPDSDHHLVYSGHGGPGGRLFAASMFKQDAYGFLEFWSQSLGRPLGVIDMGGPCNKGSFADLENFCKFVRYFIASDLPNGGYSNDDWTIEKHQETDPDIRYHDLFASHDTLEAVLKSRIDLRRKDYEYSRTNMVTNQVAQANYLYSCEAFSEFQPEFRSFFTEAGVDQPTHEDVYQFMIDNQAPSDLIALFDQVFVHKTDNRDFFTWSSVANGMLLIMESY